jgi:Ca2+-binding RTX toxin-like protein
VVRGTAHRDVICATRGRHIIHAGAGNDVIRTGAGNDVIYAGRGDDSVSSGDGNDRVYGGPGRDTIDGDGGADRIGGDRGNDRLAGGRGNDVLSGGPGADVLDGGPGENTCDGNGGGDTLDRRCDREPPRLVSLTVSQTAIDTSQSEVQVTVTAHITDDLSGLQNADLDVLAGGHEVTSGIFDGSDRVAGTALDGIYQSTLYFRRYTVQGRLALTVDLWDIMGDRGHLGTDELASRACRRRSTSSGSATTGHPRWCPHPSRTGRSTPPPGPRR